MTFETFGIRRLAWLSVLVMLAVLAAPAWAQSSPPDQPGGEDGPVNAMCPVTTDEPVDPRFTVEYQGHTIGFCCRRCLTKFQTDPTAYLANLPASYSQNESGRDQHAHEAHEEGHEEAADDSAAPSDSDQHEDEDEHAHTHETAGRSNLAEWIGKFHPPATHLPIGLLMGAAIAELGVITTHRTWFRHAAGFCLVLGTIGTVIAATLGWFNGGFTLWDGDWVQATHRWLGTATAGLSLMALVLFARTTRPSTPNGAVAAYRAGLFVTTLLVGTTGFFGGALVYGINHYAL